MEQDGLDPVGSATSSGRTRDSSARRRDRSAGWIVLWLAIGLVVLTSTFVVAALYTDRPEFCSSCHEMVPYYEAWSVGKHSDVACIECHVDRGLPARFAHKLVALGEVRSHFTGDDKFPRPEPPNVPSRRCLRCHPNLPATTPNGFPHGRHARKGTCAGCHPKTGHDVKPASLQAAGVYDPRSSSVPTIPVGAIAAVGAGTANVPGHPSVTCSHCHDLAKTGCKRCHTSQHKPRGDCLLCHRAGTSWKFVHPNGGVDCATCHKRPSGHTDDGDCTRCHNRPGKTWMYTHRPGQDCATCHKPPAKHRSGECDTCHQQAGVNWGFTHPDSGSNCRPCHQAPAAHYAGNCARCHHRVGASWEFAHPSAGEHSWRSRPCKKCHPSGTATVSCTCHGGRPPRD